MNIRLKTVLFAVSVTFALTSSAAVFACSPPANYDLEFAGETPECLTPINESGTNIARAGFINNCAEPVFVQIDDCDACEETELTIPVDDFDTLVLETGEFEDTRDHQMKWTTGTLDGTLTTSVTYAYIEPGPCSTNEDDGCSTANASSSWFLFPCLLGFALLRRRHNRR